MNVTTLITFPARPIQGGRLDLAPPKRGLWFAEPKLNGWRALIHTPTGTMWNRHGALIHTLTRSLSTSGSVMRTARSVAISSKAW